MQCIRLASFLLLSYVVFAQSSTAAPRKSSNVVALPGAAQQKGKTSRANVTPQDTGLNFTVGTYDLLTNYLLGGPALSVAIADLNNDGKLDIVASCQCGATAGAVSVLLGNGDGSFQTPVNYPSGGNVGTSIAVADVNGDGKPDIVVVNSCSTTSNCSNGNVGVLLGNGDGTFQTAVVYTSAGNQPQSVAVSDLNGDGSPDIAVANLCNLNGSNCETGNVAVLLNNGDGTFQSAAIYSSGGTNLGETPVIRIVAADVNGDGKPDLLVSNPCVLGSCTGGTVGVLLGNGDGTFQTAVTYGSGDYPADGLAVADVNGDGKPDVLVTNEDGNVGVLLGNGDGTFQTAVTYNSGGGNAVAVALADVNGDGKLDLLVGENYGLGSSVGVLLGNGDGTFQSAVPFNSGGCDYSSSVVVGDLNGDGKPDMAVADLSIGVDCVGGEALPIIGVLINETVQPTATSLQSSPNPSNYGQSVTFTATVTSQPGFYSGPPTGTVSFLDGTTSLGSSPLSSGGTASFTTAALIGGTQSITATYSGDSNFGSSTSAVLAQVVRGAVASISATSVDFGDQSIGFPSTAQPVTLMNAGNVALTLTISLSGANSGSFSQTNNCGSSLAAGGGCTINVIFTPTASGAAVASISIADNAPGSPQTVSLTGDGIVGISGITLTPSSITFPNQYVGTSGLPQNVTLINNGNATLTISSVTASPSDFAALSSCGNSVAAGASCSIGIFFDPTTSGARSGLLTVAGATYGGNGAQSIALGGNGLDFSMSSSGSSSATVSPGQTANYTIAIAPGGGFNQTVALACTGAPALSTCSVSPASVKLGSGSATSVTVMLATSGSSASLRLPGGFSTTRLAMWLAFCGWPGLVLLGNSRRKRHVRVFRALACLCLIAVSVTWFACGSGNGIGNGGSGVGTPAGNYSLTVTGTFSSGAINLTHNTTLKLVVQ